MDALQIISIGASALALFASIMAHRAVRKSAALWKEYGQPRKPFVLPTILQTIAKPESHTETLSYDAGLSSNETSQRIIKVCESNFHGWEDGDIYVKTEHGESFSWSTLGQVRRSLSFKDYVQPWATKVTITTQVRETPFYMARLARGQAIN